MSLLIGDPCSDNDVQRAAVGDQLRGPAAQQQRRGTQVQEPQALHGHRRAAALRAGKNILVEIRQMIEVKKKKGAC